MIITIKYNYDNDWHTIISTCKQVDKAAIAIMSDKELSDMGISAVGDRVKLRAFCQRQSELKDDKRAEMKRKLSAIMEASKSSRLSKTTAKKKEKTYRCKESHSQIWNLVEALCQRFWL